MIPGAVTVGDQRIPAEAIATEVQLHPAATRMDAWAAAARALVVRTLLLGEADRLGIAAPRIEDSAGRTLADDDARIEALLDCELRVPDADAATCRRYFEQHRARFRNVPDSGFDTVRPAIAEYLVEAAYRQAVAQYIAMLAARVGVSGIDLFDGEDPGTSGAGTEAAIAPRADRRP